MVELLNNSNMSENENIFDLIDKIEERTSMWIPDKSIESLSNLLFGYLTCLKIHDIIEKNVPDFNYFSDWLKQEFDWNLVYGWADAIKNNCTDSEDPLTRFFSLSKVFLQSR